MPKIVPIVEGDGEVEAVPLLIGKILAGRGRTDIGVARTRNAHGCKNLQKPGGVERFVQVAALEPDCGAILILMDADKVCPVELALEFTERIKQAGTKHPVVVAIAKCEYEAWFLASWETIAGRDLDGRPGLPPGVAYPTDVETLVGVKGWLDRQFPGARTYKETLDQAIMTRYLNVSLAESRSRSFRRLQSAIQEAVAAIDNGQVIITPDRTQAVVTTS